MKRVYIVTVILCFAFLLSSCEIILQPISTDVPLEVNTQNPQITQLPLATQAQQITQPPISTESQVVLTVQPVLTPAPAVTPYNTMDFYSCYAFMVSYNPSNGWAEFDYFYMLKGQDAIDYLVDHDGYSQSDAEDLVNDFADGEYVCQNNNTTLRTIDLDTVPVKLMYHPDGTMVTSAVAITSTIADVTALYNLNPNYLFEYFFFYIHCDANGNIVLVEQIYWC